jgi:protein TonB
MRLYTILLSIAAHAAALIVLVIVPLAAMDALPGIRVVPDFVRVTAAELPEVPPPPRARSPQPSTVETPRAVAPTSAPDRIVPETIVTPSLSPFEGPVDVPGGDPDGIALPVVAAPPAPPPPNKPVRPGGDIRPPAKIKHVAPVYPPIAVQNKVQGTVILDAVIGENGRIRDLRILRSIQLLDRAAMDAVRQWQFTPTMLNGQPVPIVMTVTVTFQLQE